VHSTATTEQSTFLQAAQEEVKAGQARQVAWSLVDSVQPCTSCNVCPYRQLKTQVGEGQAGANHIELLCHCHV